MMNKNLLYFLLIVASNACKTSCPAQESEQKALREVSELIKIMHAYLDRANLVLAGKIPSPILPEECVVDHVPTCAPDSLVPDNLIFALGALAQHLEPTQKLPLAYLRGIIILEGRPLVSSPKNPLQELSCTLALGKAGLRHILAEKHTNTPENRMQKLDYLRTKLLVFIRENIHISTPQPPTPAHHAILAEAGQPRPTPARMPAQLLPHSL